MIVNSQVAAWRKSEPNGSVSPSSDRTSSSIRQSVLGILAHTCTHDPRVCGTYMVLVFISADVVRLFDRDGKSFEEIAHLKNVDYDVARRAYHYGHREDVRAALARGEKPAHASNARQRPKNRERSRQMLGDITAWLR